MPGLPACVSHPGPHSGPVSDYFFQKRELKPAGDPADVHDCQKAGPNCIEKKEDEAEKGRIMLRKST